jgi:uncharacterized membrane protein YkvA (DUF1232 family)
MKKHIKKFLPMHVVYKWYRNILRHPKYRWFVVLGTLLYILNPADFSPDFLPVLGWVDDGMIATLFVTEMSQVLLTEIKNQKAKRMAATANQESSKVVDVEAISIS